MKIKALLHAYTFPVAFLLAVPDQATAWLRLSLMPVLSLPP
jgi:hypothetical protein